MEAAIKKSKSVLEEEDLKNLIVLTSISSVKEAGIRENELDFDEMLEAFRKSVNQLGIKFYTSVQ